MAIGYANNTLGNVANGSRDKTESEMVVDRFDAAANQIRDLADRLTCLADRVGGAVPQAVSSGADTGSSPIGLSHVLRQRADSIGHNTDRAFEALTRLEKFA